MGTIKVGDFVEATLNGVQVEGQVVSVSVEWSKGGPVPYLSVRSGDELISTPAYLWHAKGSEPFVCPDCNGKHENSTLDPAIYKLFDEYNKEGLPEDQRRLLLLEMAQIFADTALDTDFMIPESVHDMVSDVHEVELKLERTLAKLGRSLTEFLELSLRSGRVSISKAEPVSGLN